MYEWKGAKREQNEEKKENGKKKRNERAEFHKQNVYSHI